MAGAGSVGITEPAAAVVVVAGRSVASPSGRSSTTMPRG